LKQSSWGSFTRGPAEDNGQNGSFWNSVTLQNQFL